MTDLKAREEQLKQRLEELEGRLHRIEDHLEQTPNPDWKERATDAEMDEVLDGLGHAGTSEVQTIKAALARIGDGSYGACLRCGKEISARRLDLLPHAALCKDCARETAPKH